MTQSTTVNKKTKKKPSKQTLMAFDLVVIIASVLYILADFYNDVFPWKITLIALLVVIILAAIGLLIENRFVKGLVIFLILAMSFMQFYTRNGIDRLINKENNESHTVSIIVTKDSSYSKLKDVNDKVFLKSDLLLPELLTEVEKELKGEIIINKLEDQPDEISAINALMNDKTKVLIFDEAMRGFVKEMMPDFDEKTIVLKSYKLDIEKLVVDDEPVDPEQVVVPDNHPDAPEPTPGADPDFVYGDNGSFTLLISGIDVTGPVSTVSRSDVNILMTLNPTTRQVLTTSIPRDTFLPISCFGNARDKLTHAGIRGISCTQKTLANYLGVRIDYYMKVNFTSVIKIMDVVGNVDVYSHYTFIGAEGSRFVKGINTINSKQALEFARTRYTVPGGDLTRGIHQQELIKAVFNKMMSPSNILKVEGIINSVSRSIDTNISPRVISNIISKQLNDGGSWDFNTMSLSGSEGMRTTYLYPRQKLYIMYPSNDSRAQVRSRILDLRK